jgi:NAD(P)-dependent dehydrogenase (short-subunit alcohol dehydrogenase family)
VTILDLFRLEGRVAIVTGGSSGLGIAFAQALAEAGGTVVLAARRRDRMGGIVADLRACGFKVIAFATDVGDPAQCENLVERVIAECGQVDVLVNNAGVGAARPALRETPEEFRGVIDVNLNGSYWMAQACGRVMRPGSSIVNVSSVLGLTTAGLPQAAYSASKAGLLGLTRDLAQQWGSRKGIRVNAIAPGFFASEMTDQYPEGYLDSQTLPLMIPRMGHPAELASAVVWLASDAGGYVTGQTIVVDGGFTLT